jgi:hypothetical protein
VEEMCERGSDERGKKGEAVSTLIERNVLLSESVLKRKEERFYNIPFLPISISKPVWTRYLRFLKCLERKCCPKSFVSGKKHLIFHKNVKLIFTI